MIPWLLYFFIVPGMLLAHGALAQACVPTLDPTLVLCLISVIYLRSRALPGLLFCVALARALLLEGSLAAHFLALAVPVAALLPMRGFFYQRSPFWQCAAAAFLAFVVPRLAVFFSGFSGQMVAVAPESLTGLLWSTLLVPPAAFVLQFLPPFSSFRELEP